MKWNRKTRRFFLQGATATLALPFLSSLMPKAAKAERKTKTFIGIGMRHGMFRMYGPDSELMPKTPEDATSKTLVGFEALPIAGAHTIHYAPSLTALATANNNRISSLIDEDYYALLPKMTMLQGLDYVAIAGHHRSIFGCWDKMTSPSGNPPMASIDVVLANYFASLGLSGDVVTYTASKSDNTYGFSFQEDGVLTSSRFRDPLTLWEKYFGGATIPKDFRTLLVDRVIDDYKALTNNPRLGGDDLQRVQAHVDYLHQTEAKIVNSACVPPAQPPGDIAERLDVIRAINDVIVALIACGMCHSFMGSAQALVSDDPEQLHAWAHAGYRSDNDTIADASAYSNVIEQNDEMLRTMCLDLAMKLEEHTLLDDSLIVWLQEHNKRGHEAWNVPAILFGGAGGAIATNQYVDYRNIAKRDDLGFSRFGFPMNQFYASILMAMGMTPADFEKLNKERSDGAPAGPFKPGSGYGICALAPNNPPLINHYDAWAPGYDMSAWLPRLKA